MLNVQMTKDQKKKKSTHISTNLDCIISCGLQMALSHRFGTDFKESLNKYIYSHTPGENIYSNDTHRGKKTLGVIILQFLKCY